MNTYEMMIIYSPQLSDNQIKEAIEKTKKIISSNRGEILMEDSIGRKKFSHAIKKHRDGFYHYMKIKVQPEVVKDINYEIKVQENVLRVAILTPNKEGVKKA